MGNELWWQRARRQMSLRCGHCVGCVARWRLGWGRWERLGAPGSLRGGFKNAIGNILTGHSGWSSGSLYTRRKSLTELYSSVKGNEIFGFFFFALGCFCWNRWYQFLIFGILRHGVGMGHSIELSVKLVQKRKLSTNSQQN